MGVTPAHDGVDATLLVFSLIPSLHGDQLDQEPILQLVTAWDREGNVIGVMEYSQ